MRLKKFLISGIIGSDVDFLRVIWRWNCCTGSRRNEYSSKFTNFSVFRNRRGRFPVSSVNDGRGDDTQNDNYRWFSKEALKGSGARGNAAYLNF